MGAAEELLYTRGELSVDQVQAEIAQFWQTLDKPGSSALDAELSEQLNKAGLDRAALATVDTQNAITVRAATSGADPIGVVLLITLAPSTNLIIRDLWVNIVLPRIRRRWGEDAIGEEKRGHD
jgi:hypothetical protein